MPRPVRKIFRTFTGLEITADKISEADIDIRDIAVGLQNMTRYSGQLGLFYSVAAHSLWVSDWIESHGGTPKQALEGLLHDASEAYLSDLASPWKKVCPDYRRLEHRFMTAIRRRFGLPLRQSAIVTRADDAALFEEWRSMSTLPFVGHRIGLRIEFIRRYSELGGK